MHPHTSMRLLPLARTAGIVVAVQVFVAALALSLVPIGTIGLGPTLLGVVACASCLILGGVALAGMGGPAGVMATLILGGTAAVKLVSGVVVCTGACLRLFT